MREFETDYIAKIIDIMKNNELTEVTLEDAEKSLFIKGNGFKPVIKDKETQQEVQLEIEKPVEAEQTAEKKDLVPITSKMIGLYFSKPSPEEQPFVKAGDEIKEGQVICIIETIKLVNKITSDVSGRVAKICIDDGKPVEYGQVIMYVEQN